MGEKWMDIFYHLAKGDALRFKEVADLNYVFVLNFLTHEKKEAIKQNKEIKKYEQKIK